jgi:hypothetical protein
MARVRFTPVLALVAVKARTDRFTETRPEVAGPRDVRL